MYLGAVLSVKESAMVFEKKSHAAWGNSLDPTFNQLSCISILVLVYMFMYFFTIFVYMLYKLLVCFCVCVCVFIQDLCLHGNTLKLVVKSSVVPQ